jgi:hypothetical protein
MLLRRPVIWVLLSLAVILGALVGILLMSHVPSATAGDGRKVTIERTTYGTEHRFVQGPLWGRILTPLLGTRWAARHHCFETRFTSTNPVMVVWTRWSGISRTNPLPQEASLVDASGTESELVVPRWNQTDWWTRTNRFESTDLVAWVFPNYPRRDDPLRLRIYDHDTLHQRQRVVEMAFPNPGPTHYEQWAGKLSPIIHTNARGEFTLKSFAQVTPDSWDAVFEVRTNGSIDSSWQFGRISAHDATGNFVSTMTNVVPGGRGPAAVGLRGALWPHEHAWKISAEFYRGFDFASNECWTTPQIPLRPMTQVWSTNLSLTNLAVNGSMVVVGELQNNMNVQLWRNSRASLLLTARLLATTEPSRLFVVNAVDDRQRPVEVQQTAWGAQWQNFSLLLPSDGRALQLTLAVRKATLAEFEVANPLAKRAK